MGELTVVTIIEQIQKMFDLNTKVSADYIYTLTELSEDSFAYVYFAVTKECVIKIDGEGLVSMYNGGKHTHYIRIRDATKEQVKALVAVRKPWKEATVRLADVELEQAYTRLLSL